MIYIPIFVNIVLLLLFGYRYLFFSLIVTISYEIRINVPVTGFQFPYQRAFGHPAITEQLIWSHLVCQTCNQKRILSQMSEQCTHFLQVFSQNAVSLTFCQSGRKLFPFSDTVTVCNIRMMFRTMPSFIFLDTSDSRFPT